MHHLFGPGHAAVQGTAGIELIIIGRHDLTLTDHIPLTKLHRIHSQPVCQLIHGGLHGKDALGCSVSAVSARGHMVRVNHIIGKTMGLQPSVEGNGLVTGKANRRRSVLTEGSRIGKRIHPAVLIRSHFYRNFHLVTGRGSDLTLFPGVNHLRRLSRGPGDKSRINLRHKGLLRAKTAADSGLAHPHLGFWNSKSRRDDAAGMEDDLRGADDVQSSVGVHTRVGPEGLHHGLLVRFRMVGMLHHHIAVL